MDKDNIKYYCVVFLEVFNELLIQNLVTLNQVNYLSIVYKPTINYSLNSLVKYMESLDTKYKWKIHSIVRDDVEDGEIVDMILDTNYNGSQTNYLIISKKPYLLTNEFIDQASEIIMNTKYSSDLFGAISSQNPYDIFCTQMSIYLVNDKNRDQDILSKIKLLDRKIYEV